ncbi:MAG: hypothetical protein GX175_03250 [Halanaerobiaceae bacterium]|nr:hypothetical protein [Halanaerobiaceae bacterium]
MKEAERAITHALAGEIFNKLKDSEYGEISFKGHRVLFESGPRNQNNEPEEATVEVIDQEGYRIGLYNLEFENQE